MDPPGMPPADILSSSGGCMFDRSVKPVTTCLANSGAYEKQGRWLKKWHMLNVF